MPRAIWNGDLRIADSALPVHLYSAVQDRAIHFHLLDANTHKRVKQHMVDPDTGKEVDYHDIRKGYEVKRGVYVIVEPDEIASVQPKPSRDIDTLAFLPAGTINHQWYERPYYVGPADESRDYFAVARAMKNQNREGLVRWVMRGKEYLGALRERDGYLVLMGLHYVEEVLSARELPRPGGRLIDAKEIEMAEQLVSVLKGDFHPEDFRDEYRDRVMKYIEKKAEGQKPKLSPIRKRARPAPSLTDMLAASLRTARGNVA